MLIMFFVLGYFLDKHLNCVLEFVMTSLLISNQNLYMFPIHLLYKVDEGFNFLTSFIEYKSVFTKVGRTLFFFYTF